ncbi:MAG: low-specificity L-threonine aldolase [candidate division Zixibacteria bacterium]|nr:low-specificity L-threonine aldolase [candidate division Zixibacteria bacterium]
MKIIDLRSDTITRPSPEMREAIANAEVGDDVFGDDPTVNRLQEMTADLLGKEAALYFPSGTMSNQVALRCLTNHGDEAIIEQDAHIFRYEAASGSALAGIQFNTIKGNNGVITAEEIEDRIRPADYHQPKTAVVCLENTHNKAGGMIFPLKEIQKIRELCLSRGIKTYIDGARIWNASIATGVKLTEYTQYCDLVSVCLSKGLGAPVGSVLAGDKEMITQARRYRKAYGGGMRQAGIIAAAGIYALENNIERLKDDHNRAQKIAKTLSKIPSINSDPATVQTNLVVFDVFKTGRSPLEIVKGLKQKGLLIVWMGENLLRAVCHLDVDDNDIDEACEILTGFFSE